MKIFLVGFMGSGKSSFGERLAIQLEWEFVDTDKVIERKAGLTIPEIFETKGEEWFRALEREVLSSLPETKDRTVVALGGGAVCRDGIMEMLNEAGTTVYLKMSPERIVERIDENGREKRPKIRGMNDRALLEFINEVLPEREKHYNKAALIVDCDSVSDERITGLLLQEIADL